MTKQTKFIRIRPEDSFTWREYCKALGSPSPDLFSKIINSKELNLNQRVLNEIKKKQEELKKSLFK
jgi:hypothetical protein